MNGKVKNFFYALSANIINFGLGIVTGFMVPAFLGLDQYGYFKVFTFYLAYVGLLHFGFIDGIYIKYGNYDYEDIPKEKFRGYFRFLILQQIVLSIILLVVLAIYPLDLNGKIIILFVLINMLILNATTFFAFICQFTKRFKLFSINTVLTKLIFVSGCIILFAVKSYNYIPYMVVQTICNIAILVNYMVYNKELVFGKSEKVKFLLGEIKITMFNGFFIMLGNFMSIIIVGVDRMFINKFFSINDFAYYSFAYTLVSLFYILLNSVTTVIYPYLSRIPHEQLNVAYKKIKPIISLVLGGTLAGYFLIKLIIIQFLPKYIPSLYFFICLTPTVLLSGQMSILIANYFKVLKLTKEYTKNSIVALILAIACNGIAYIIFKSTLAIAIATLIVFIIWVLYSERFFSKRLSINIVKYQITELIIIGVFLICASFFNWYVGLGIYIIFYAVLVILNKNILGDIKEVLANRK